jgi:hypothetical protein
MKKMQSPSMLKRHQATSQLPKPDSITNMAQVADR